MGRRLKTLTVDDFGTMGLFQDRLDAIAHKLKDTITMLDIIGIEASKDIEKHFDDQKGPRGSWKKLAKATIKKKGSSRILEDKGFLKKINYKTGFNTVRVGTPTKYGQYHDTGTNHVPKRQWAYLSVAGQKRILKALDLYFAFGGKVR